MSAAWESLHLAARELASSDSIKQRLTNAFSKHIANIEPEDLPAELRGRFRDLHARMTAVRPMRGDTAVCATVRKMSNEEAAECARTIVDLLGAITPKPPEIRGEPRKTSPASYLPRLIAEA